MRLISLLLLLPLSALAGEATLTCDLPTKNTDGSDLTDLAEVRFYGSQQDGGPYNQQWVDAGLDCSETITGLSEGTWYFVATAVNSQGVESDYSGQAQKTIAAPIPNPPSNLVVLEENLTAYYIQQSPDVIRLHPLGTVPAGTPCDPDMYVNGRYRVPVSALTLYQGANIQPATIYASCGSGA